MISRIKKILNIAVLSCLLVPARSFAQFELGSTNLQGVIMYLMSIFMILNPILFSLCFIIFFWGLSKFILNSDSKEEIEKGKSYMVWGVIALFILVSLRGILVFITSSIGISNVVNIPYIPHG